MTILIKNIKQLVQVREDHPPYLSGFEMAELPYLENAFVLIEHDTIVDYGLMQDAEGLEAETTIDATGKTVLPAWCDSHTHIVYAGNREHEFIDRIKGLSYEEIAEKGGGILNSAEQLRNTDEDELYRQSIKRIEAVMQMGTGAVEIKSGYGLTVDSELKMLRVIKRIKKNYPLRVKGTFLGAHALPENYKGNRKAYVDLIIDNMLPAVVKEGLAQFVDVFCEEGYFSVEDTDRILTAAVELGMQPKIHVNQFNDLGGVSIGVKHKALSVDHLEIMEDTDLKALHGSHTMPVALPGCSLFLGIPYTPGRKIIDAGLPLAIATDYNPGSAPSGNMNLIVSLATIKMKLTSEEAINAATINGAYAMGIEKTHGSITKGKKASLIIFENVPSYHFLPYSFGENHIDKVIINGQLLQKNPG